jgi:hypothetical protein
MIDSSQLEPLRQRRAQTQKRAADLRHRLAKLEGEISALERELSAMDTTLETLAKIYGISVDAEPEERSGRTASAASTKPDDAPTLFEMVSLILDDWDLIDDAVEGQQIYDEIKKRWWPDAPRNSIIPSLWRFAQEGRLIKDGTKYGLPPKKETPGVSPPSASILEGDLDDEIPF